MKPAQWTLPGVFLGGEERGLATPIVPALYMSITIGVPIYKALFLMVLFILVDIERNDLENFVERCIGYNLLND
jgi:hypothetical protein